MAQENNSIESDQHQASLQVKSEGGDGNDHQEQGEQHQGNNNANSSHQGDNDGQSGGGASQSNDDESRRENGGEPPVKKLRGNEEFDIRFLVSSKDAGAIIGKGGSNIMYLRKNYKASVTIPDCPGPERVLSVVANIDSMEDILKDVINYMDDKAKSGTPTTEQSKDVELRLLVHTSHAGGIIGKGGQRIRDLREQTKAAIKVYSVACPHSTERVCAVQGLPETVIQAIKTICEFVAGTPIKGKSSPYDPYNHDPMAANDYGGYTDRVVGGTGRIGYSPRGQRGGATMWHRDGMAPPPQADMAWYRGAVPATAGSRLPYETEPGDRRPSAAQLYPQRWGAAAGAMPQTDAPYWTDVTLAETANAAVATGAAGQPYQPSARSFTSGFGPVPGAEPTNFIENADGSTSATISVPNDVAGAIIGKGGNRIRTVRRDSGAEIAIDNSNGQSRDRIITIKGTQPQVRMAYTMLQRSIAENTRATTRY